MARRVAAESMGSAALRRAVREQLLAINETSTILTQHSQLSEDATGHP